MTLKTLKALAEENWVGIWFRVILGPGYVNHQSIAEIITNSNLYAQLDNNPVSLIPLLQGCDLALCAGGRTIYELYNLDKNFLPIASAEHEAEVIKEFIRRKMIPYGMVAWKPIEFIQYFKKMLKMEGSYYCADSGSSRP